MPLVDTGLVCRYYFDEAASGTTPTAVEDHSSNNYDLTEIDYGAGNMFYTEVSGNRGLESTVTTGVQRARRTVSDTSDALRDAIDGLQKITFELVLAIDNVTTNHSRVFVVNDRVGSNARIGLNGRQEGVYFCRWNGNESNDFNESMEGTRKVFHIVYDTTQAAAADRAIAYVNNVAKSMTVTSTITQNSTLSLGTGLDLIACNRENAGTWDRSFDGTLFYAAIYTGAMSAADRTTNYDVLSADDDAPPVTAPTLRVLSSNLRW
jgi:hypothetical protein